MPIEVVDVASTTFRNHGLCNTKEQWINGAVDPEVIGPGLELGQYHPSSFHPKRVEPSVATSEPSEGP